MMKCQIKAEFVRQIFLKGTMNYEVFQYLKEFQGPGCLQERSSVGSLTPVIQHPACTKDVSVWISSSSTCTTGLSLSSLASSSTCSHSASWLYTWWRAAGIWLLWLVVESGEHDSRSRPIQKDNNGTEKTKLYSEQITWEDIV